jgi:hypothetical protein
MKRKAVGLSIKIKENYILFVIPPRRKEENIFFGSEMKETTIQNYSFSKAG